MAKESINLSFTQEICESNGYSSAKTSKKKLSLPDNGSGELPENHRTSSDSSHDCRDPRKSSTGKPSPASDNRKIVPHYLRASTGSCHDFCKYGRKQAFEEKEIRPWRRRTVTAQTDKHNPAVAVLLGERTKVMVLKRMTLPNRKSISFKQKSSPAAIKLDHVPVIAKKEVLLPSKKGEASSKKPSSLDKKSKFENRVNKLSSINSLSVPPPVVRQLSPSHASAEKTEKAEKAMKSFSQKSFPTVQPGLGKPKSTSSSRTPVNINGRGKRRDDIAASKNMVAAKASSKKVLAPPTASSTLSITRNISLKGKKNKSLRREDIMASKNMVAAKASSKKVLAPPTASLTLSITRNISLKGKKNKSLKQVSPLIDRNSIKKAEMGELENQNVPEKTLHVIVIETENNISESTADSEVIPSLASPSFPTPESLYQCQSPPLSSQDEGDKEELEGESEQYGSVDEEEEVEEDENGHASEEVDDVLSDKDGMTNDIKTVEGNRRKNLRKGSIFSGSKDPIPIKLKFIRGKVVDLQSESSGHAYEGVDDVLRDKDEMTNDIKAVEGNQRKNLQKGSNFLGSKNPTLVKLKFRRGKVVDLRSESNGPRRLQFRRGRVIDERLECQDRKGDIRRRTFKKKRSDGDGIVSKPSDEKLVLRHQDMQEKKDAQGLLNNVIEETASKLVESRKSKVKALVGAFETVISLQDTKPSS